MWYIVTAGKNVAMFNIVKFLAVDSIEIDTHMIETKAMFPSPRQDRGRHYNIETGRRLRHATRLRLYHFLEVIILKRPIFDVFSG